MLGVVFRSIPMSGKGAGRSRLHGMCVIWSLETARGFGLSNKPWGGGDSIVEGVEECELNQSIDAMFVVCVYTCARRQGGKRGKGVALQVMYSEQTLNQPFV
eukprot:492980-Amphidinium_carterae.1